MDLSLISDRKLVPIFMNFSHLPPAILAASLTPKIAENLKIELKHSIDM